MLIRTACTALTWLAGVAGAGEEPPTHRILLILADDLGVEQLALYRPEAMGLASTPAIDEIASRGVTFRNAWANPLCSPTRATIQTGKYACRTGIGHVIETLCPDQSLPAGAELPILLPGLRTGAFGKWHLEDQTLPDPAAPWSHGYDYFEGTFWGVPFGCGPTPTQPCNPAQLREGSDYFNWQETTIDAGSVSSATVTDYLPAAAVESARAWIQGAWSQSWFCYLAPQAPFELQHCPPAGLQSTVACASCGVGSACAPGVFTNEACFRAALEALDAKIGDLLRAIEQIDPESKPWWRTTTVIFVGDNGTGMADSGFWPVGEGKGSLSNGGIHVPFIIAGEGVPKEQHGQLTEAVASGVDVYATVLDLAGEPQPAGIDGVSLVPVLADPSQSARSFVYSELFSVNGPPPHPDHCMAIADGTYTYKLRREASRGGDSGARPADGSDSVAPVRGSAGTDYFYLLAPDPSEPNGPKKEWLLCSGAACAQLPPAEASAYAQLQNDLAAICP